MRVVAKLLAAVLLGTSAVVPVAAAEEQTALPVVDFTSTFPWLVWVSSEGHDSEYPAGFVYKILTVRSADSTTGEIVLIRQLHDGTKSVAIHAKGALGGIESACQSIADKFSALFKITFQKFDLRDVHDASELQARVKQFGWSEAELSK